MTCFLNTQLNSIINTIKKTGGKIQHTFTQTGDELTILVEDVKMTFLHYPFPVETPVDFDGIAMPDIKTLGAMKAYALGRRSKWKDYVDLFFVFEKYATLAEITGLAKKIFGTGFNEKLFREQLCYYKDIDFSEAVSYMPGKDVFPDKRIKDYLTQTAIAISPDDHPNIQKEHKI